MAGGPWSVKGIAPQAREAAKDAARRQGKTLGEWLNEIILETGDEAAAPPPDNPGSSPSPSSSFPSPSPSPSPSGASAETLEELARRLEAAEHRSTLAITGIDQSVRGLISRLEATERGAADAADMTGESVSELHHGHSELARRLAALESDPTARQGLEAVKTLENAVATVAGHVHDRDKRAAERADSLETRLGELDSRFAKAAEDLARRVDAASDHAAMQAQRAVNDLRAQSETRDARTADALAGLEATIGRINQRLTAAETLTDNAMRSLEASFAHLDNRLRGTEEQIRQVSPEGVAETLERKFETLGRELRERIDQVRAEAAETIDKTAPRIDRLERALEKSDKRNRRTLNRIGEQIGVLGQAVERRLEDTERRLREDAIQDRSLETRLREVENSGAEAIRKVAEGVEQISMRLAERIEASELRNAEAVSTLGKEIARLADRPAPSGKSEDDVLAARLRESERRTQQMIRDAVAGVSAKLDAVRNETESGLSPVQSAMAHLASRLEAIENGEEPPPAPPPSPAPPRQPSAQYRSSLPPAEEALSAMTLHAGDSAEDAAPETAVTEPEPEDEVMIEPPARPNPFIDTLDDGDSETFAAETGGADAASPDAHMDTAWAEPEPAASESAMNPAATSVREEAPPLGATASSDFLAAARRSARNTSYSDSRTHGRGSVLEQHGEERSGGGRKIFLAAGFLAVLTVGGAAALLFREGVPFGQGGARVTAGAEDPAVVDMLNGGSAAEFAAVDGVRPATLPAPAPVPAPETAAPAEQTPAPAPGDAAETAAAETVETAETVEAGPAAETPAPAAPQPEPSPEAIAEPMPEPAPAISEAAPPVSEPEPLPEARILSTPPAAQTQQQQQTGAEAQPGAAPEGVSPLQQAAFEGDPVAQYQLGEIELQSGNAGEGAELIRAAAGQGHPPAQYRLGKLYESGAAGVPRDDGQARLWTERAANAGNRNAMHNLGLMYAEGRGAPQDDALAAQWFESAALAGATDSQFNLAVLYEQGRGVPQSLPDAYAWYRIAERAGDREAGERASMLAAQIPQGAAAEAERVASAFQPRALDSAANATVGR